MELIDQADHILPYLRIVRQTGAVPVDGVCWSDEADRQRQSSAFAYAVGDGDLCGSLRLGDGYPEGQHLLDHYNIRVAGGNGALHTAKDYH